MAQLSKPLEAVMNVLNLVAGFIKRGVSGVQKEFKKQEDDLFLPVIYISIKDLKVDPKYQRLINTTFIKKAKEFDPYLVKPLSVFKRPNGTIWLLMVNIPHVSQELMLLMMRVNLSYLVRFKYILLTLVMKNARKQKQSTSNALIL